MPTYVRSVLERSVDDRQKETIAEAIARIDSEETDAKLLRSDCLRQEKSQPIDCSDRRER
jgi:hypothetical protein